MSVINLITVVESDTYNADSSDWLALTDAVKSGHIFNASLYMQTRWTCTDIEWDDTTTMTDNTKRACAYYAEADRLGLLFQAMAEPDEPHGRLIETTEEISGMRETNKWSSFGPTVTGTNPLEGADALMMPECTRITPGSAALIRV